MVDLAFAGGQGFGANRNLRMTAPAPPRARIIRSTRFRPILNPCPSASGRASRETRQCGRALSSTSTRAITAVIFLVTGLAGGDAVLDPGLVAGARGP